MYSARYIFLPRNVSNQIVCLARSAQSSSPSSPSTLWLPTDGSIVVESLLPSETVSETAGELECAAKECVSCGALFMRAIMDWKTLSARACERSSTALADTSTGEGIKDTAGTGVGDECVEVVSTTDIGVVYLNGGNENAR